MASASIPPEDVIFLVGNARCKECQDAEKSCMVKEGGVRCLHCEATDSVCILTRSVEMIAPMAYMPWMIVRLQQCMEMLVPRPF